MTPTPRPSARRRTLLVASALLVPGLACGGDDSAATGSTEPETTTTTVPDDPTTSTTEAPAVADACALVSQDQAEALAGTPLESGVLVENADLSTCTYAGPVTGPTAQVEVFVGPGAEKFLDIDRELGHTFTEVPGIGDEAHEEEFTIFLRKGPSWVSIRLVRLEDPATYRVPLQDLARQVADAL